jgi:predicted nucleic acid-binding protein
MRQNKSVLIDSGPLIALFNKHDNYYHKMLDFFRLHRYHFFTTLAVLTEVLHFLSSNIALQINFLTWVMQEGVTFMGILEDDIPRIADLMAKYADRPMDFTDATLIVAAEKTGMREIVSIDSDFDIYRVRDGGVVRNVFER